MPGNRPMIDKEALAEQLAALIELTEKKIAGYEEMSAPVTPDDAIGRVSRMDAINNKSVAEAALRSSKQKLGKLKVALQNIDQPSFGVCALCKQAIPAPRLMYMPESTRCVRCAER